MNKVHKRVGLNLNSANAIDKMSKILQGNSQSLKFTDSQLVMAIVDLFSTKYFKREENYFEQLFFDRKKALRQIIKDADSSDDLEEQLSKLLRRKSSVRKLKVTEQDE